MIDPPGTCHLVGCPDKGRHAPHRARRPDAQAFVDLPLTTPRGGVQYPLIGAPDTFEPYVVPPCPKQPVKVQLDQEDAELLIDTMEEQLEGRIDPTGVIERMQRALAVARNTT